jgi:hypothetical protein
MYFKINIRKNNSLTVINSYENKIKKNVNEFINEASFSKYKKNQKNIAIICTVGRPRIRYSSKKLL